MSVFYRDTEFSNDGKTVTIKNLTTISATGVAISQAKLNIGTLASAYSSEVVATDVRMVVSISQDADVGADNTIGAAYFRTATGIAQTGQLATLMARVSIAHNLFDAYGTQSHIELDDDASANAAGNLAAISGKFDFNKNTLGAGLAHAGLFIVDGGVGAVCSGTADVVWMHIESGVPASQVATICKMSSGSTVASAFNIAPANVTNFLDLDSVAGFLSTDTGTPGAATTHKIKINIGTSTAGYIPVYASY